MNKSLKTHNVHKYENVSKHARVITFICPRRVKGRCGTMIANETLHTNLNTQKLTISCHRTAFNNEQSHYLLMMREEFTKLLIRRVIAQVKFKYDG